MKRPVFAIVAALVGSACPGPAAKDPTDGTGSGPPPLAKKVALSWGVQAQGEMTDLYLALRDETGSSASHELGRWKGACEVITPAPEMNALSGVRCKTGGTGSELHVVTQGGDKIIVLKMGWDEGAPQDPMSREEVKTISVPLGVAISVDPIVSTTGAPGVR